jgi:hypothetical protein
LGEVNYTIGLTKIQKGSNISSHALKGAFFVNMIEDSRLVLVGRGQGEQPTSVTSLDEMHLPKIEGVEFADFSAELDALIGHKSVQEVEITSEGEQARFIELGQTLREIIQTRAFMLPLVVAYRVGGFDGDAVPVDYFIGRNVDIVEHPYVAAKRGHRALALKMRKLGQLGIVVPFNEKACEQTRTFTPETSRIISIDMIGSSSKGIGAVTGLKSPKQKINFI